MKRFTERQGHGQGDRRVGIVPRFVYRVRELATRSRYLRCRSRSQPRARRRCPLLPRRPRLRSRALFRRSIGRPRSRPCTCSIDWPTDLDLVKPKRSQLRATEMDRRAAQAGDDRRPRGRGEIRKPEEPAHVEHRAAPGLPQGQTRKRKRWPPPSEVVRRLRRRP